MSPKRIFITKILCQLIDLLLLEHLSVVFKKHFLFDEAKVLVVY